MKLKKNQGFTLVEMAIVLLIMALLLGGGLTVLTSQTEQQHVKDTQRLLDESIEALIGFALANGRLPCPASGTSAGQESFCTNAAGACGAAITPPAVTPSHGRCTNAYNGFLPAATLGIATSGGGGFATDAWGITQNRIRYAVSTSNAFAFTALNGMSSTTMATLAPDLRVCASATGITTNTCGSAPVNTLTINAVAVVYSVGGNAAIGGTGIDESANPNPNSANNDQVFVSHTRTELGATNGSFDDIVTWLPPGILFNRLVQAGKLP